MPGVAADTASDPIGDGISGRDSSLEIARFSIAVGLIALETALELPVDGGGADTACFTTMEGSGSVTIEADSNCGAACS